MLPTRNDKIFNLVLSNYNNVVCDVTVGQPLVNCDLNVIHFKYAKLSFTYEISVYKSIVVKCNFDKANFAGIALYLKKYRLGFIFL